MFLSPIQWLDVSSGHNPKCQTPLAKLEDPLCFLAWLGRPKQPQLRDRRALASCWRLNVVSTLLITFCRLGSQILKIVQVNDKVHLLNVNTKFDNSRICSVNRRGTWTLQSMLECFALKLHIHNNQLTTCTLLGIDIPSPLLFRIIQVRNGCDPVSVPSLLHYNW